MGAILCALLVACGGGGASTAAAEEPAVIGEGTDDATALSLLTFVSPHVELYKCAAERWNEENPDEAIKLVAESYPFDQMHNNLLLALQSSKGAPDIADLELGRFANFLSGEPQLEPMNEYVEPVLDQSV